MTAPGITERIDAVTALFATTFTAGVALLLVFAVAYVIRAERLRRPRNPYMAAVERGRKRGAL